MRSRTIALILGLALSLAPLTARAQQTATQVKDTTKHAATKLHHAKRHVKHATRRHAMSAAAATRVRKP